MAAFQFDASINTTKYKSDAEKLQSIAQGAAQGITRHFGKIATAVVGIGAAFIGVRAAVESFNAAVAMGGQLNDLSARTGETAGNLAILQRAFENAGAGAESVGPTINRLQRAIVEAGQGGKEQAEAFAKLGINLYKIKNLTPTEQLQAIAKALQNVGNDSDRTAIAMQLLGRSGGELIPLLRAMGSELDIARGQLGSTPAVMDRVAGALDTLGDNFNAIGHKGKEFAAGLLERAAPALVEITNRIANIDAAGLGAKLSDYAVRTGQWMSETLKLNEALKNIEIAVKGITSGNFGDGFKLMFLTARDTAFAAINQIVAAAKAAMSGIGEALQIVFNKDSVTMAYIRGAFSMLGAQIAATMSSQLANVLEAFAKTAPEMLRPLADKMADSFLPGISFMGKQLQGVIDSVDTSSVGAALRAAQADAETAIKETAEIMAAEAGNLKDEWSLAFASAPKAFADAYESNMRDPLIEMGDYVKETKDLFEELSAKVRAAAFDANEFAGAIERAYVAGEKIDPFKSPFAQKPDEMGQNDKGFKFPWQGSGPSGPQIDIPAPGADTKGKRGGAAAKPQTALDALRTRAEGDASSASALGRIMRDLTEANTRADDLTERGAFFSAARVRQRAEDRANRRATDRNALSLATDRFEGGTMGEAFSNYLQDLRGAGMSTFGETREKFEKSMRDQVKTEAERKAETDRSAAGGGGGAAAAADPLATIVSFLQSTFGDFKERVPQNALTT